VSLAYGAARDVGVIPILRSGVLAADMCRRIGRAEVAAVYERSFYLRAADTFVCVGVPAIGNGPLTLIAAIGGAPRWTDLGLRPGQRAAICAGYIAVGDAIRFDLADCAPWHPPAWPAVRLRGRVIDAYAALVRRSDAEAPAEGLAGVVFGVRDADAARFSRIARKGVAGFESWLGASPAGEASFPDTIRGLIGLGPGLTPSGDDFLSGALAVLDALGERRPHAALAQAVVDGAALTSPLSACFLRAAAGGHIGEQLHDAVAALIVGDVDAAIAAARHIGHSSGWDMLAGAATALRIVARS
jgi:Protein of unknown function (DUF2877)